MKAAIKPAIKPRVNAIRIVIIVFYPFLYPNGLLNNGSILFIGNSLERFNLMKGARVPFTNVVRNSGGCGGSKTVPASLYYLLGYPIGMAQRGISSFFSFNFSLMISFFIPTTKEAPKFNALVIK